MSGDSRPLWTPATGKTRTVIRTDGVDDYMQASNSDSLDVAYLSLFMVLKYNNGEEWPMVIRKAKSGYWTGGWGFSGPQDQATLRFYAGSWNVTYVSAPTTDFTSYAQLTGTYDKDLGSQNLKLWVNSVLKGTDDVTASISAPSLDLFIGDDLYSSAPSERYAAGVDFAEILMYERVLSTDEIAHNESYLNTKWGL